VKLSTICSIFTVECE